MNTTFPPSGKTFCLHLHLQNLRHSGKLYPTSWKNKAFPHMNKTKLFDLSKRFLGNRDNFCPYEQALNYRSSAVPVKAKLVTLAPDISLPISGDA